MWRVIVVVLFALGNAAHATYRYSTLKCLAENHTIWTFHHMACDGHCFLVDDWSLCSELSMPPHPDTHVCASHVECFIQLLASTWDTIFYVTWALRSTAFRLIFHPLDSATLAFLFYRDLFYYGVAITLKNMMPVYLLCVGLLGVAFLLHASVVCCSPLVHVAPRVPHQLILFGDNDWRDPLVRGRHLQYDKAAAAA
jgi:hypothetical protein